MSVYLGISIFYLIITIDIKKYTYTLTNYLMFINNTLLNLANGYSLPSSATLRQWKKATPSSRAGFINGAQIQGRTRRIPNLAFWSL